MTLLDLCEPLLQYICRLNRAGRKAGNYEYVVVRGEIKALFEQMRSKALAEPKLNIQYKAMEMPFTFFVDSMISESGLSFAAKWNQNRLAYEQNELAGDEKFFDCLDETLADPSDDASERLAAYYTMIGLGFTGWYVGQPEYLRKKMLEIAPRIRAFMETDQTSRLCPESYEKVDARDLIEPPSRSIALIAIIFVTFSITTLACNYYLFNKATSDLMGYLREIIKHEADFSAAGR